MLRWGLLAMAAVLAVGTAQGATVKKVSLGSLMGLSELVIIGTVVEAETYTDRGRTRVMTRIKLKVEDRIKGQSEDVLVLEQLGGRSPDGKIVQKVSGQAAFSRGERVLLFIERADSGRLVVAGMSQGKFSLKRNAATGVWWAYRDISGLAFFGGESKVRRFAFAPENTDQMPLDSLLRLLKEGLSPTSPQMITLPVKNSSVTNEGEGAP